MRQVDEKSDNPDRGADEAARLEQIERQDLGDERREHVEAAAIGVEIDEGERALIAEARCVEAQQQAAIFGVGVVVPAEPVVAEREGGDDRDGGEHRKRQGVGKPRRPRARWSAASP